MCGGGILLAFCDTVYEREIKQLAHNVMVASKQYAYTATTSLLDHFLSMLDQLEAVQNYNLQTFKYDMSQITKEIVNAVYLLRDEILTNRFNILLNNVNGLNDRLWEQFMDFHHFV